MEYKKFLIATKKKIIWLIDKLGDFVYLAKIIFIINIIIILLTMSLFWVSNQLNNANRGYLNVAAVSDKIVSKHDDTRILSGLGTLHNISITEVDLFRQSFQYHLQGRYMLGERENPPSDEDLVVISSMHDYQNIKGTIIETIEKLENKKDELLEKIEFWEKRELRIFFTLIFIEIINAMLFLKLVFLDTKKHSK